MSDGEEFFLLTCVITSLLIPIPAVEHRKFVVIIPQKCSAYPKVGSRVAINIPSDSEKIELNIISNLQGSHKCEYVHTFV